MALIFAGFQWAPYEAKIYWQLFDLPRIFLCCLWAFGFIWPTMRLAYLKRWASLTTYAAMCLGAGAVMLMFNSALQDDNEYSALTRSEFDLRNLLVPLFIPILGLAVYLKERLVRKSEKMNEFLEFHRAPDWVRYGCETTLARTIASTVFLLLTYVLIGWLVFGVNLPTIFRVILFLCLLVLSANLASIVFSSIWMLRHCRTTGLPWKKPG